jgi:inner membrane protein
VDLASWPDAVRTICSMPSASARADEPAGVRGSRGGRRHPPEQRPFAQRYRRWRRTATEWKTAGAEDLRRLSRPEPAVVLAGAVLLIADQTAYVAVGSTVLLQAPLDWIAHVLTTALIVWGLAPGLRNRVLVPALVASVAIDVDHIPGRLGYDWLTAGTSRPYTHSLATVVVLLIGAGLVRSARAPLLGVALGVASHLWRDLAEPVHAGVALVWPISDGRCEVPQAVYLGSLGALALIAAARALHRDARLSAARALT